MNKPAFDALNTLEQEFCRALLAMDPAEVTRFTEWLAAELAKKAVAAHGD
jgi:hypothetical protein